MSKLKKQIDAKIVKSVNKNVRSSTRKLNPLLKSIVGKKVDIALKKQYHQLLLMQKITINTI